MNTLQVRTADHQFPAFYTTEIVTNKSKSTNSIIIDINDMDSQDKLTIIVGSYSDGKRIVQLEYDEFIKRVEYQNDEVLSNSLNSAEVDFVNDVMYDIDENFYIKR